MMSANLPLLSTATALDSPLVWHNRAPISCAAFLRQVAGIARHLPNTRFIFNLCEDRYRFMAVFAAVGVNGQTNLLPSSRADRHLQQLATAYPDSAAVVDAQVAAWLALETADDDLPPAIPELPAAQITAIAYTSGSTGQSRPHPKTWGELVNGAQQARQRFGFATGMNIVATVPPQHMYGLETSIMAPLASGISVHAGRPFFPEDVRTALLETPDRRILVTTPVHLRACVNAGLRWPDVTLLISATAPLAPELAAQAEAAFNALVLEIYGCTEAGSIASRRTLDGDHWRLYDGFHLHDGQLSGAHLPEPITLSDRVEECSESEFRLIGRSEDLVNIAGKRSSLAYLNHQINAIAGVTEGVFAIPDDAGTGVERLIALVVAPDLSERQILAALVERLDPVFLPRPLLKVAALPRNETGKIARENLLALVAERRSATDAV